MIFIHNIKFPNAYGLKKLNSFNSYNSQLLNAHAASYTLQIYFYFVKLFFIIYFVTMCTGNQGLCMLFFVLVASNDNIRIFVILKRHAIIHNSR